ncbi:epoxide hydrolase 1-like [Fundulus heteroclitus]|uniref:epoxide hydrolase 1-like n=1 Tax=Fundulus heteroclitus TaxID=8078 RepID=UPI00165BE885|nr:epoxide hydrolase 1-like [Fundulus heteroclitus]XP_035984561.1 epoxide hydrolase 1-like [Fundulus heteroclitus]
MMKTTWWRGNAASGLVYQDLHERIDRTRFSDPLEDSGFQYGFNSTYLKKGFNSLAAARIFLTLMERLGFSQFYLQGGDWGSLITTNMAQMRPEYV